ncbi:MAG: lysophospholipase [Myxococcota bacterium]|nr:lysophospholipase [Myxococcota bacterium]
MTLLDREDFVGRLFYPRADTGTTPAGASDHAIEVDGATLQLRVHGGRLGERAPVVLLFHGNGEIVADWDATAPRFASLGLRFAVVDYRGYGRSTGIPTMQRLLDDAHVVLASVRAMTDGPLFVMGRSLGSAAAWEVAADGGIAGLIVDSGFADVDAFAQRRGVDPASVTDEERAGLDPLPKIAAVEIPVLMLHGEEDTLISIDEAERARAASRSARLVRLAGRGHNDLWRDPAYWPALAEFLTRAP